MYQVVKRDGKVTEFEISKISKAITKAFALGCAFNKARNIRDKNTAIVNFCDTKIWRNGRKWIVGNFWRGITNYGKKSRFASVWETNKTNVCAKF